MPLAFIEVKKPNNREGVLAERNRIITRSRNPKFRRFINITQLMVFSNNMEYEDGSPQPIEGAFYASPSYDAPIFNYFREEETLDLTQLLADEDDGFENEVLRDNNLNVIKHSPEFLTNKSPDTPTNRICTSLFSRDRLAFLLRFALAYVNESDGLHKHVMRYPQLFATKAIEKKLECRGQERHHLAHAGQRQNRAGLLQHPLPHRLLPAPRASSPSSTSSSTGWIWPHRRSENLPGAGWWYTPSTAATPLPATSKPRRCCTTTAASPKSPWSTSRNSRTTRTWCAPRITTSASSASIFWTRCTAATTRRAAFWPTSASPTATPSRSASPARRCLGDDYNSRALFGDYIHKYYYNASIADGYTLRLIREEIATNYKLSLQEALAAVKLQQGDIDRKLIYSHPKFVEPMLDYIVRDFEKSRSALGDASIGGMVICDSAEQAARCSASSIRCTRHSPHPPMPCTTPHKL
jgi:type I restriction enzyme R subunit